MELIDHLITLSCLGMIVTIMGFAMHKIMKMLQEEPNEEERRRMIRIATYGAIGVIV